jgi:HD-GYP domain-containing protein (c-di-GMP phosphodiesterase class II)
MKLSQAMGIMHKFRMGGHIDPDLFDVFVNEQVYLRYAEQFLDPWQIDAVNPASWPQ